MARVATCPQCSHEILILDDGNQEAWAKCPECRAFFQIFQAAAREIQSAIPVEKESIDRSDETVVMDDTMLETFTEKLGLTLLPAADATLPEYRDEPADDERGVDQDDERIEASDELTTETTGLAAETRLSFDPADTLTSTAEFTTSGKTLIDESARGVGTTATGIAEPATPEERLEEATDRIDKWFRKTKSEVEAPIAAVNENVESAVAGEIPVDQPPDLPEDQSTWDDSDKMERLLADIEGANAVSAPDEGQFAAEDDSAHSNDESAEAVPVGQHVAEPPPYFIPPGRLPRRRKSMLRMVATTAISGMVGLVLGYYVLLWILGPTGDFLNISQYLPNAALPAEFQSALASRPVDDRTAPPINETLAASTDDAAVTENNNSPGATEQTSYAAPVDDRDSTTTDPSRAGDQPPMPFEESTAAPLAQSDDAGVTPIANAPAFSADELAVALQAAQEAQPKLVAGNFADGRAVQLAKGQGYSVLCDLAQKLTFVDPSQRADYATALVTDSDRLFQQTLADTHTRDEVARILPIWIASPNRKHGGVFFAGTPLQSAEQGSVVECQLDTGADKPVIVLVPQASAARLAGSSKTVGIVGWIVDSPATVVSGYTGNAPQAIWAGRVLGFE